MAPLYQDDVTPSPKDPYYREQSAKAIAQALEATEDKTPEERRTAIRRSYPFGPQRKGRPYKIWNRMVLEKEVELGLEPRKHKREVTE